MGNWLTPYTSILESQDEDLSFSSSGKSKEPSKPLLYTFPHASPPVLLDFLNGLSDDVYAFHRCVLLPYVWRWKLLIILDT
jgi:hypothetical protein